MLNTKEIIENANRKYAAKKMEKGIADVYTPPEALPSIKSDQVIAVVEALVENLNKEFENE